MQKLVNVSVKKQFTVNDLNDFKILNQEDFYPERYHQKSISKEWPSMKFHGVDLIDIDAVTQTGIAGNTQESRASGGNSEYADIRKNISSTGFDLSNFPISIRRLPDGKLTLLDGRTRFSILKEMGLKNVIVAIYSCSDDDASKFGIWSNTQGYRPRGYAKMEDIYKECLLAVESGWIHNNIIDIKDRIDSMCKEIFTDTKRSELTLLVHNHYNQMHPDGSENANICHVWQNATQIKTWLTLHKYVNTNKIIYFPVSFSTVSKGIINASKLSYENPDAEIRVVIHTGVLTANDLEQCYKDRVVSFKEAWENNLGKLGFAFFDSIAPTSGKIKLYGALPAVSTLHPLDKMIRFGYNDSHLYLKSKNSIVTKLIGDEEDELSIF
jgi:hypothetical protein